MPDKTNKSTSGLERHRSQGRWLFQVTGLATLLGILLGASMRAQQNFRRDDIPSSRYGVAATAYTELRNRNLAMATEVKALEADKNRLEHLVAEHGAAPKKLATLRRELKDTRAFSGLDDLYGAGVVVTLRDSPLAYNANLPFPPDRYGVRDDHIFAIINELRAAGAEAVAINDQRLIATTGIKWIGDTLHVNYAPVGLPLRISAIGNPRDLAAGLQTQGSILDPNEELVALKMATVTRLDRVEIPAYKGQTAFQKAHPEP